MSRVSGLLNEKWGKFFFGSRGILHLTLGSRRYYYKYKGTPNKFNGGWGA